MNITDSTEIKRLAVTRMEVGSQRRMAMMHKRVALERVLKLRDMLRLDLFVADAWILDTPERASWPDQDWWIQIKQIR